MWNSTITWHFYKWIPSYWPPEPWQTVGSSGPSPGATIPWWLESKDKWPYPAPWEPKVMGSFSAMWFKMREDIGAPVTDPPGPWPSTPKYPPFGLSKVNTRPDGIYGTTKSVATIKVHMRPIEWLDVNPHPSLWAQGKFEAALREMSRKRPIRLVNEDGSSITVKALRSANWSQHKKEYDKRKAELRRQFK